MKCDDCHTYFAGYQANRLEAAEIAQFEQHLGTCPACREAFEETALVLNAISGLKDPQPPASVQVNFRAMLDDFKSTGKKPAAGSFWAWLHKSWLQQPRIPLAYGLTALLICTGAVYLLGRDDKQQEDVRGLQAEVRELKQTVLLSMLGNPLASERIKAANYSAEIERVDNRVINALLATLNNDPNVNVRLSTLEALAQLAANPVVRAGLVESITRQDSPVIQVAIVDVMLRLQEKRAVDAFKQLLQQKGLDDEVRDKVKQTIVKLI